VGDGTGEGVVKEVEAGSDVGTGAPELDDEDDEVGDAMGGDGTGDVVVIALSSMDGGIEETEVDEPRCARENENCGDDEIDDDRELELTELLAEMLVLELEVAD
jgi:hypothetical protein